MKRRIAIVLAFVYLSTATELNQLWKVPIFISHFIEHNQEDPSITLGGFITLHYFSGDVRDADWARDEQLPFRNDNQCACSTLSPVVPPSAQISYQSDFLYPVVFAPKTQEGKPNRYQTDIWQPPRA